MVGCGDRHAATRCMYQRWYPSRAGASQMIRGCAGLALAGPSHASLSRVPLAGPSRRARRSDAHGGGVLARAEGALGVEEVAWGVTRFRGCQIGHEVLKSLYYYPGIYLKIPRY